jgi:undecaprenyl-diphosphatase
VVLNVHHPSDVLAGWALGLLYYLICVVLVPPRVSTDFSG